METARKILSIFTRKQKRKCAFILCTMILGALLEAVGIGAILPLISLMGKADYLDTHAEIADAVRTIGVTTHVGLVMACAGVLIAFYLCKNMFIAWSFREQIRFVTQQQISFSCGLMESYLAKPYLFHVDHNTATLLSNVTQAGTVVFINMMVAAFVVVAEAVTALAIWGMLAIVDLFTATVAAAVLGGVLFLVVRALRRVIMEQGVTRNTCRAVYTKYANQALGAIKETRVLQKEAFFSEMFASSYRRFGEAEGRFTFVNQLPRAAIESMVVIGLLGLILSKLWMGENPLDIVPLLGVLALAAFRMMPSTNRMVVHYNQVKFFLPTFLELYEEYRAIGARMERGEKLLHSASAARLPLTSEIAVEHLSFSYPEGQHEVLTDVSFTIPKGKFVGIVGPSGAGKTTFVDILLGLFTPSRGRITVDGQDIAEHMSGWLSNLAYVPQNIYLVDGTIRENIALGEKEDEIDDARVQKALIMAELHDFVAEQQDGIYTMVGERGVKLSGGQRQRIGIARALYQEPNVLVLDEATSALDHDTEKAITDTILKFKGKITIVAIAHRVSTLSECDFKVEFSDGKASVV